MCVSISCGKYKPYESVEHSIIVWMVIQKRGIRTPIHIDTSAVAYGNRSTVWWALPSAALRALFDIALLYSQRET